MCFDPRARRFQSCIPLSAHVHGLSGANVIGPLAVPIEYGGQQRDHSHSKKQGGASILSQQETAKPRTQEVSEIRKCSPRNTFRAFLLFPNDQ